MDIAKVELKLGNEKQLSKDVGHDAHCVTFDVELPAGDVDVEAWLIGPDGKRTGAYFVYVQRI